MEIVAIVGLGRNVEQEAPLLAADLGLTTYEVGILLRGSLPIIILRTEDRSRTLEVLGKVRSRGHDAVACDLEEIASSDEMFRPKTFRIEGGELVAMGHGETQRLLFTSIFAIVRATHAIRTEETVKTQTKTVSLGRAAATGGLMMTKTTDRNATRVKVEREPVLYLFRSDSAPWLIASQAMRYDGLGPAMRVSTAENFEIFVRLLRESAPDVPYDTRLLQVRAPSNVISSGAKHLATSSAGNLDILAHVVAITLNRNTRPYR